ncbi:MAG TPA: alpha-E domain-containing protein [Candidatus Binataceae bacterium]|nr:alpha-E domain-containing protein [Candidatus Binataceae bacterium]
MLRRIAGSLFWAARYLERAQWRARLVDVNYHLLLEVPPRDAEPWEPLVRITAEQELFATLHSQVTEAAVIDFFVFDKENRSSIRNCIEAVRANLSPVRHLISSELWIEVNRLYLESPRWSAQTLAASGVSAFFADLQRHFYTIAGIIGNTMPRDLAYDLIEIGTMLERPDNVSRLLDVKYHYLLPRLEDIGGPADLRQWAAVLRSASAFEAFRKVYGNAIRVNRVVEILVFDPAFPRSMRFCIERLAGALARLAAEEGDPSGESPSCDELLTLLRNGSAEKTIASGLHEFLIGVEAMCARLAAQVFDRYLSLG